MDPVIFYFVFVLASVVNVNVNACTHLTLFAGC